jgi:hypothetical protein
MASKSIPQSKPGKSGTQKPSRELEAKDLDKVTGGRASSIGNTKEPSMGG